MPGHVKLGAKGEADPDPTPFLVVSMEMKREAMAKPYDSKKSYWCPDGSGGFVEGLLESDDGKKAVVNIGHEKKTFKLAFSGSFDQLPLIACKIVAPISVSCPD